MSTPGCQRWPTGSWARRYILWALSLRRGFTWSEPSTSALPIRRRFRLIVVSALTTELMHCHFSPRHSCSSAIRSSPLQRRDKLCLVHKRWDSRIRLPYLFAPAPSPRPPFFVPHRPPPPPLNSI